MKLKELIEKLSIFTEQMEWEVKTFISEGHEIIDVTIGKKLKTVWIDCKEEEDVNS